MASGIATIALYQTFGVGFGEIIVVAIIFLLLFGPNKLPQMARDIGRFVAEARRSVDEFKEELMSGADNEEDDKDRAPKVHKRKS